MSVNIGISLLFTLMFYKGTESWSNLAIGILWGTLISTSQWLGHSWIAVIIDRRISWLEAPIKRALYAVLAMVFYSVFAFLLVELTMQAIVYGTFPKDFGNWAVQKSIVPLILSFIIGWSMAGRGFFVSWRRSEKKSQALKVEMLNYRYEALRNQINPHFLFNSFNVLSDLVYEDQELAVKFIRQLSDLYRYVLDSREKELVPLQEELEFIESFIFLLKTRFEDKIEVSMELQAQADEMIVPMTLQLLIENAVKHNEASKKHPLKISVAREDGKIVVRNGLRIRSVGDDSKQTGLKNISQQYAHLSEQQLTSYQIEIEETESEFVVRVPVLKQPLK